MLFALCLVLLASTSALAADHKVIVGSGGLKFEPSSIQAAVGDRVTFSFPGSSHTATMSSFAQPCTPDAAAAFSAVPPGETDFWVESTNATWFFCATGSHCADGMVFAINPAPEGEEKSYANFKALAMGESVAASGPSSTAPVGTVPVSRSASASSPTGASAAGSAAGGSSSAVPTVKGLFVAGFVGGTLAVLYGVGAGL